MTLNLDDHKGLFVTDAAFEQFVEILKEHCQHMSLVISDEEGLGAFINKHIVLDAINKELGIKPLKRRTRDEG